MSAKNPGNDPAHPAVKIRVGDNYNPDVRVYYPGMTKRELFAAMAMPAVLAAYVEANGRCIGTDHVAYNTAGHAVRIADALLAELAKEPT